MSMWPVCVFLLLVAAAAPEQATAYRLRGRSRLPALGAALRLPIVSLKGSPPSFAEAQQELQLLKEKMERLERQWASLPVPPEGFGSVAAAQRPNVNTLDSRTVELCASAAFFVIGHILGASLFDRLGLVGGVAAAYWASGAVNHDSRAGSIARDIGQRIAQVLVQLQLRWNELVVFYKTGKLAFLGKAQYEKLDNRFAIEKKINEFKRLSMMRIAELGQREVLLKDKVADVLAVLRNEVGDPKSRAGRSSGGT